MECAALLRKLVNFLQCIRINTKSQHELWEAKRTIDGMAGSHQLMIKLMYGSGLRVTECVRLRVKDMVTPFQSDNQVTSFASCG